MRLATMPEQTEQTEQAQQTARVTDTWLEVYFESGGVPYVARFAPQRERRGLVTQYPDEEDESRTWHVLLNGTSADVLDFMTEQGVPHDAVNRTREALAILESLV